MKRTIVLSDEEVYRVLGGWVQQVSDTDGDFYVVRRWDVDPAPETARMYGEPFVMTLDDIELVSLNSVVSRVVGDADTVVHIRMAEDADFGRIRNKLQKIWNGAELR